MRCFEDLDAANWARIQRVVIEYHDIGRDQNHAELADILCSNGFDVEAIHGGISSGLLGVRVGIISGPRNVDFRRRCRYILQSANKQPRPTWTPSQHIDW